MRRLIQILSFLAIVNLAAAQPTRTEVINTTTPAEDNKSNSDKVPDAYALTGQFDRVLVLRFKNQTDLLPGLERQHLDSEYLRTGGVLCLRHQDPRPRL